MIKFIVLQNSGIEFNSSSKYKMYITNLQYTILNDKVFGSANRKKIMHFPNYKINEIQSARIQSETQNPQEQKEQNALGAVCVCVCVCVCIM